MASKSTLNAKNLAPLGAERLAQLLIEISTGDAAPAAEELSERHPLAATVALRAMIDFTLREARQKRYGYAAQHLATCADLANRIEDFAPLEPHEAYVARLRAANGKKTGFWGQLA